MFQAERENKILEQLQIERISSATRLQKSLQMSIATIRRDLISLEKRGLVVRRHGYVQLAEGAAPSHIPDAIEDKELISRAAAAQIHDGDTIFLGSGTTCNCLAKNLQDKKDLTIMTINLDMISTLIHLSGVKLSILGGEVHLGTGYIETMDEFTIQRLKRMYFDKVFVTVDGIDFDYGYSIRLQMQLPLFEHLLANSKEFYCLADSAKFNRRTYMQFCSFDAIRRIVTTPDVRERYAAQFREHDIRVICEE